MIGPPMSDIELITWVANAEMGKPVPIGNIVERLVRMGVMAVPAPGTPLSKCCIGCIDAQSAAQKFLRKQKTVPSGGPQRYRKRPVEVEAMQWDGSNLAKITEWARGRIEIAFYSETELSINTLNGQVFATLGEWIVKDVKGEFYPCKPDIFAATYEAVEDE